MVVDCLERTLLGEDVSAQVDDIISRMPGDQDQRLSDAIHALQHFYADQDIRQHDLEYDRVFREQLSALLVKLRIPSELV